MLKNKSWMRIPASNSIAERCVDGRHTSANRQTQCESFKRREVQTSSETEQISDRGQVTYHPDIPAGSHLRSQGVGPFIKAYAIEGFVEFAFSFSAKTLGESKSQTPGMRRVKTLSYKSPLEGTPHFAVLNSFSGKFLKDNGEIVDRPLGAFEVSVWIKEPGTLACSRAGLLTSGGRLSARLP